MINKKMKEIGQYYIRTKLQKITQYFNYNKCKYIFDALTAYSTFLEIFNKPINEQIRDLGI